MVGGGVGETQGRGRVENPFLVVELQLPLYVSTSLSRSTEFNVKLVVAAAARVCHKFPSSFFRSCPYFRCTYVYRTHLAALAGMHAVVETGGLIPADATEHGGAIEFCKKQNKTIEKNIKNRL